MNSASELWTDIQTALLCSERPSEYFSRRLRPHFPELAALVNVEQDPRFHPEGNVWNHTAQVLDYAARLRDQAQQPLAFMLSALCHDLGKLTATARDGDRIRAIGHEQQGLPFAEAFLRRFTDDAALIAYVLNMVELHMRPNLLAAQSSGEKATNRLFRRSLCPADLLLLSKADHCSRPNASAYETTELWLRRRLELYQNDCRS